MKEFENWNKLRGIDFRVRFSPPKQFETYIEQEREDSYTAALEWVVKMYTTGYEPLDFISDIQKELDYNAKTQERPRSGLRFSS